MIVLIFCKLLLIFHQLTPAVMFFLLKFLANFVWLIKQQVRMCTVHRPPPQGSILCVGNNLNVLPSSVILPIPSVLWRVFFVFFSGKRFSIAVTYFFLFMNHYISLCTNSNQASFLQKIVCGFTQYWTAKRHNKWTYTVN